MIKAAFLDRDGVINKEVDYLYKIDDFEFTPGCIDGLQKLSQLGFTLFVVTNQSGIGRGYYTEADYHTLTRWYVDELAKEGIAIEADAFCPYHPDATLEAYRKESRCRKPNPGMILDLAARFPIDLAQSIMIGDKISDAEAGQAAGVGRQFLVRTGHLLPKDVSALYPVFDDLKQLSINL